jgi:hypothetical protein
MSDTPLIPFADDATFLLRNCRLPLHSGIGKVDQHGDPNEPWTQFARKIRELKGLADSVQSTFAARFFLPVSGNCKVFLQWPGERELSRNFGRGLTVTGESPDGPFRLECPEYYVKAVCETNDRPGWAIAAPINQPVF